MFARASSLAAAALTAALLSAGGIARAEVPSAWSPWLALEAATGPASDRPLARTERLLGLGRAFVLHRRLHPDLERLADELERRIAVLDAGSFYEVLGRGHPKGETNRWFELQGRWAGRHYPMKAWRKAPEPTDFGEARAHFGLRPTTAEGGFVLKTEIRGHLGDLRFEHVAAFVAACLSWLESTEYDHRAELRRAFPRTAELAERYARIRSELSPSNAGTRVRLEIALDPETLGRGFPGLGRTLERLRGLADADIRVESGEAELVRAVVDSKALVLTLDFTVAEGKLAPTRNGRRAGALIDLPALSALHYVVRSDLRSNLGGLEVSVRDLSLRTEFRRDASRARWSSVLDETPAVEARGSFGIIPLWMVDAFIPKDVKSLAEDFFRAMAEGNGGAGLRTRVDMPVSGGGEPYALVAEGELLSNGFLTFCLRAVLASLGDRKVLRAELARLWSVFLDAFEADLRRVAG